MLMKKITRRSFLAAMAVLAAGGLAGCAGSGSNGLEIIRIGHNQSTNHPTHTGLLAFQEFISSKLGDKYDVQIFPSELLGSQNEMVQLTQTGAITFCVASNSLLETFSQNYTLFNLPYVPIQQGTFGNLEVLTVDAPRKLLEEGYLYLRELRRINHIKDFLHLAQEHHLLG